MSNVTQNSVQQKLARIKRFLQSPSPLLLIIGDAKSGRSECLALLMQQMSVSRFLVAFKATTQLKPKYILNKFSQHWSAKKVDRSQDLHTQLEHIVQNLVHHDQRALLLIDDADALSASMLEIITHLTRIQEGHAPHLHIILAGSRMLSQKMHLLHHKSIPQLSLMPTAPQPNAAPHLAARISASPKKHVWTATFRQMMQHLSEPRDMQQKPATLTDTKRKRAPMNRKKKLRLMACCGLILTGAMMWWYDGQNDQWQVKTQLAHQSHKVLAQKQIPKPAKPILLAHSASAQKPLVIIQAHQLNTKEKPLIIVKIGQPIKQKPLVLAKPQPIQLAAHQAGFTLQLVGSHHKKDVRAFISQHHLANTHIIKTKYHQKNWYALAYGHYKTHQQAIQAKQKLPADLKNLHPWVRKDV